VRNTKSEYATDVKILMSQQYNKVENRKRRNRYLKRKKLAAKKKTAAAAAKPAA
jgi:hypothetical protein